MSGLEFRVLYPDGRNEQLTIDSDSVLIGSGAHCDIRLPAEQAAVEHVMVTFLGGAVYAQARYLNPPPCINGAAFTQTTILADSVMTVGHVQMMVSVVDILDGANVLKKNQAKASPVTLILAAILMPAAAYMLLSDSDNRYNAGDMPEPPPL